MMYLVDKRDFAEKVNNEYLAEICEGKFDDINGVHSRVILLETLSTAPNRLKSDFGYVRVTSPVCLQITYHNKVDYMSLGEEMDWWRSGVYYVQINEAKNWYKIFRAKKMLPVKVNMGKDLVL